MAHPKRSGRKPSAAYGIRPHRCPPGQVDRVVAVGLLACCPGCGGELERVATQQVEELPPARPLVTRFQVQVGRCPDVRPAGPARHPGQASDVLGRPLPAWSRAVALAA